MEGFVQIQIKIKIQILKVGLVQIQIKIKVQILMGGLVQLQIRNRIQILKEGLVFHLLQLLLADVGHYGSVGLWKRQVILIEGCLQVFFSGNKN